MIGIHITELKDFMGKLLKSDCFHSFLLEEAGITTAATYHIDGRINHDFFSSEDEAINFTTQYEFMPWEQIQPFCFELIKGKRTPLAFKFVLHFMPEHLNTILEEQLQVKAAVLTIKYDSTGMLLTTGISYQTFVFDKTADKLWDSYILRFLEEKGISYSL